MSETVEHVSCQTYAGGLDLGAAQGGLRMAHKVDAPHAFGIATCDANRELLGRDWTWQASDPAEWETRDVPVLLANPPCSGFSVMSNSDFRGMESGVAHCMWETVEYAARCGVNYVVMESVGQAFTAGRTLMQQLRDDMEARTGRSYHLTHILQDGYSLGGAAIRRRYFMVLHDGPFGVEPVELLSPLPTLWDAIEDLVSQPLAWERTPYAGSAGAFASALRSSSGVVDGHVGHDNIGTQRINAMVTDAWAQGGTMDEAHTAYFNEHGDMHPLWRSLPSYNKNLKALRETGTTKSGFNQPRRWTADRAGRVIHGGALVQVIHPTENRLITHREAARIMGFPDDWTVDGMSVKDIALWGKGVSVHVGKWIGSWTRESVLGRPGSVVGEVIGDRENLIDVSKDWRKHADVRGRPLPVVPDGVNA